MRQGRSRDEISGTNPVGDEEAKENEEQLQALSSRRGEGRGEAVI